MPRAQNIAVSGQKDTFVVRFRQNLSGAMTSVIASTVTTEVSLAHAWNSPNEIVHSAALTKPELMWIAPWPCVVTEVFGRARFTRAVTGLRYRVRRHDVANVLSVGNAVGSEDDIIRNVHTKSGADNYQDSVLVESTAIASIASTRYTGIPQSDAKPPDYTNNLGVGYLEAEQTLAAGDMLSVTVAYNPSTIQIGTASHVSCMVTVSRID
jgi:hypothetical protein